MFAFVTAMFTFDGPVPLAAEAVSQFLPSDVLVLTVQFRVPAPALRTWIGWLGGLLPPVFILKLNCPGSVSREGKVGSVTVRVTGTVIA